MKKFLVITLIVIVIIAILSLTAFFVYKNSCEIIGYKLGGSCGIPPPIIPWDNETAGWKTYKNDQYDFEMQYPRELSVIFDGDLPGNGFHAIGYVDFQTKQKDIPCQISIRGKCTEDANYIANLVSGGIIQATRSPSKAGVITVNGKEIQKFSIDVGPMSEPNKIFYNSTFSYFCKNENTYIFSCINKKFDSNTGKIVKEYDKYFDKLFSTFKFTTPADQATGWKTYTNSELKILILYPSAWTYQGFSCNLDGIAFCPMQKGKTGCGQTCGMDSPSSPIYFYFDSWNNTKDKQKSFLLNDQKYQDVYNNMLSTFENWKNYSDILPCLENYTLDKFQYKDKVLSYDCFKTPRTGGPGVVTRIYIQNNSEKKYIIDSYYVWEPILKIQKTNSPNIALLSTSFGDLAVYSTQYDYVDLETEKVLHILGTNSDNTIVPLVNGKKLEIGLLTENNCKSNETALLKDLTLNGVRQNIIKTPIPLFCIPEYTGNIPAFPAVYLAYGGINKDLSKIFFSISRTKRQDDNDILISINKYSFDLNTQRIVEENPTNILEIIK